MSVRQNYTRFYILQGYHIIHKVEPISVYITIYTFIYYSLTAVLDTIAETRKNAIFSSTFLVDSALQQSGRSLSMSQDDVA